MSNRQEFPQVVTWGDGVDVPEESIAISVNQRRDRIFYQRHSFGNYINVTQNS
ncbi:hypothetical protein [Nostoc sp. WHI]|uniref:hypothetical protein n=1 Tax=Nostoc sp. WHI TaxID=2650611 RepID=UPI0018C46120|nr:hypothetical protein [Nostoc sp. WHI]